MKANVTFYQNIGDDYNYPFMVADAIGAFKYGQERIDKKCIIAVVDMYDYDSKLELINACEFINDINSDIIILARAYMKETEENKDKYNGQLVQECNDIINILTTLYNECGFMSIENLAPYEFSKAFVWVGNDNGKYIYKKELDAEELNKKIKESSH